MNLPDQIRNPKSEIGFTLVELMVTIAVVGILAAGALVAINPQQRIKDANNAASQRNLQQVASALEACYAKNVGDWTKCDTWSELQTGGFVRNAIGNVIIGSNAAGAVCGAGGPCCAFILASGSIDPYFYSSSTGSVTTLPAGQTVCN